MLGLVDFVILTLFFSWSGPLPPGRIGIVASRRPFGGGDGGLVDGTRRVRVVLSFPDLGSDSRLYGKIGVVFTLATWFIVIGAVITLGALGGAVWQRRRSRGAESSKRAV
jgi:hypothetical protein